MGIFKYKQVILIRTDLKMSAGKKVAQGAHASVIAVENARKHHTSELQSWLQEGQKKVALKIQSMEDLTHAYDQATRARLPCSIIRDAGLTQLEPGTTTAVAIGPADEKEIDKITGKFKLL